MKPVMITCALTGAETTKEKQPHLPLAPEEQAVAAKAAVLAGATVIHLHVRDDQGKPTQRMDCFEKSIQAIRNLTPHVIIQISTGGALGDSMESRAKPLELKPEMASLNCGTMNFGDDIFYNHPRDIVALAAKMHQFGVIPELEIYDAGMLESVLRLAKQGILRSPFHFQFVLGVQGGMSGDPRNLMHLISLLPEGAHWGVAGVGRFQLPLAVQALLLGGNVRVGFEDNIFYEKGVLAESNAELVARVVRIARELGREVATLDQTRKMLGV